VNCDKDPQGIAMAEEEKEEENNRQEKSNQ